MRKTSANLIIFILLTVLTLGACDEYGNVSIQEELELIFESSESEVPDIEVSVPNGYLQMDGSEEDAEMELVDLDESDILTETSEDSIVKSPKIALTFDDGPSAHTDGILDLLEQYGGRSTFFVTGPQILERSATIIRAFNMGNEIANHSWSHRHLPLLTDEEIIYEIQRTSNAIISITGESPPIHRPPFGMSDERVVNILGDMGYAIVKWTLDPIDWRYRDADIVYNTIMNQVESGSIILVHDTRPTTAEAMERVIPRLIEEGFQLVTVSELLYYLYDGPEPGVVYGTYTILD